MYRTKTLKLKKIKKGIKKCCKKKEAPEGDESQDSFREDSPLSKHDE